MTRTIVHMLRHGEVHNPTGILYGRLPGYHLSDLGRRQALTVAEFLSDRDVSHVVASPLQRVGCGVLVELVGAEQLLEAADRDPVPPEVVAQAARGAVEPSGAVAAGAVLRPPAGADGFLVEPGSVLLELLANECADAHGARVY